MSEPRTIVLPTLDHGEVTLTCPAWCAGHPDHRPDTHRADILHAGPDIALTFHGEHIGDASLVQAPFSELTSRGPEISVSLLGQTLDPAGVYDLAAALDRHSDQLRNLADQLSALLAGGDR
ncbi:DUF6907 domain-containing protein [Streptomyces sp. NPDC057298]|uniref:DUF6907 domain-containing protein n=1 Tax=Streptomyces sp. NPDC057298 TaxID=3346091 RepID=UPI003626E21B